MCSSRRKMPAAACGLRVAADAFEDGRAVVDDVRHDVDLGVSQAMSLPLCQMFLVVCSGMRSGSLTGSIIAGRRRRWRSDCGYDFGLVDTEAASVHERMGCYDFFCNDAAAIWLMVHCHARLVPPQVTLAGLQHSAYVRFSLLALSSIFFLVDPFAALPTFLAITAGADTARRRRMARKAALTACVVLSAFALAGEVIFQLFGITLPAFEIAGGIILLLIGLDMLEAKRSPTQETGAETEAAAAKEDAGIVPLGIPMLAGPGSITSVMVLVGQAQGDWQLVAAILGAIVITALICYLVLGNSDRVATVLGDTGIRILVRIMGLLLVALAAQYFVNGLVDLGVVTRPSD